MAWFPFSTAADRGLCCGVGNWGMFHAVIDSGFISVTGEDRVDFVHGLVTNDVRGLQEGSGTGALLLNHRGHALAQMTAVRLKDRLLLAVEDRRADWVMQELDRHIIFDQVKLERQDGSWTQLTVQGGDSESAARLAAAAGAVATVPARRSAAGGVDLFLAGDAGAATDELARQGWRQAAAAELDRERVAGLVASAAREAGDGVLPQESGLEHLISYRKGCYLGQEIMARIEARGKLKRDLRRVRLESAPSLPESADRDIRLDGRLVGRLGTVVTDDSGDITALAVLRLDLPAGSQLSVAGTTAVISN